MKQKLCVYLVTISIIVFKFYVNVLFIFDKNWLFHVILFIYINLRLVSLNSRTRFGKYLQSLKEILLKIFKFCDFTKFQVFSSFHNIFVLQVFYLWTFPYSYNKRKKKSTKSG